MIIKRGTAFVERSVGGQEDGWHLLRCSITCKLCISRRIMQNSFYAAVNHVADRSGNKYNISERSTGHAPGS